MPKIICTVPKGLELRKDLLEVQSRLSEAYQRLFPNKKEPDVFWSLMPDGQSYVAGQANKIYLALVEVDEDLEQTQRETAMLSFTETFAQSCDIQFEKPMVSFLSPSKLQEYMKANRNRIRWLNRYPFVFSSILHVISSKKKTGLAQIKTNL